MGTEVSYLKSVEWQDKNFLMGDLCGMEFFALGLLQLDEFSRV